MSSSQPPTISIEITENKMNSLDAIEELYQAEMNRIYQEVLKLVDISDSHLRESLMSNNVDISVIR